MIFFLDFIFFPKNYLYKAVKVFFLILKYFNTEEKGPKPTNLNLSNLALSIIFIKMNYEFPFKFKRI